MLRLMKCKQRVIWREGSQIVQRLSGSHMLGVTDGNATSGANYLSMYCALEAQHPIVRMIKMLTSGSSIMDSLMIRARLLQEP
jgi:hypothetical protein